MKTTLTLAILFCCLTAIAQKKKTPNPYRQFGPIKNTLPPQTYRLSQGSEVIYSSIDNMPIVYAQIQMSMPNAAIKPGRDSVSVYRMPNPLYPKSSLLPNRPKR